MFDAQAANVPQAPNATRGSRKREPLLLYPETLDRTRRPQPALFTSVATLSMWRVWGNRSKGWMRVTV